MQGASNKNASMIRMVEKKDNIKFPNSVSFTLNIFSIQDINPVFQNNDGGDNIKNPKQKPYNKCLK